MLLYGNGASGNIFGVMPQATPTPRRSRRPWRPRSTGCGLAILQATLALYPSTGIVLNDTDWARIEMTKDTQGPLHHRQPAGPDCAHAVGPAPWRPRWR